MIQLTKLSMAATLVIGASVCVVAGDEGVSSPYTVKYGHEAGINNTSTGYNNVFIGYQSGQANTVGIFNTFNGYQSGQANTIGHSNTFNGYQSGKSNISGIYNTFNGAYSGQSNTTGYANVFNGLQAGTSNNTGYGNVFNGYRSGQFNTAGHANTFNGYQSGRANTTGFFNAFHGAHSGQYNTTGESNTFSGSHSGYSNTTGYVNVFDGHRSGYKNTTGYFNFFGGAYSGFSNIDGSFNTFLGKDSGYNANVNNSVFLGYRSGYSATRDYTLYIGNSQDSEPLVYGEFDNEFIRINGDLEVTGATNISGDLTVETGSTLNVENVSVSSTLTTSDITVNGSLTNTGTFTSSGDMNITGNTTVNNMTVGGMISSPTNIVTINSDLNITGPITAAFDGSTTKSALQMMGLSVNNSNLAKKSDVSFAFKNAREDFSWIIRTWEDDHGFAISKFGNGGIKELRIYDTDPTDPTTVVMELANGASNSDGMWINASSRALKENIEDLDTETAMEAFHQLKPVTYNYKSNKEEPVVGFIAEDVPEVVAINSRKGLNALEMVALLTKVVQEQEKEISRLKSMEEKVSHMEEILTNLSSISSDNMEAVSSKY
jgi:hypothetical protein